jgi:anti-sigma B factor antagonist/stage II sporulation protein AA (anti-sigma F factor antagonist)
MDDEFRIETFAADGEALGVRVHGELDTSTADRLLAAVQAWPVPVSVCVVDLENCEFLDSSGIRALLLCQRALDHGKGTVRLVGVKPHIERVLRIAGVQAVVQIDA